MSFPGFSRLPVELQDLIWESFIPNPTATAHVAELSPMLDAIEKVPSLRRAHPPNKPITATPYHEPYNGFDRITALRTLLQTTSGSRSVSQRHNDALSPITSLTLREGSSFSITSPRISIPALDINPNSDLIVLENGWYKPMMHYPRAPLRDLLLLEPLPYLAISLEDDPWRVEDGIYRFFFYFKQLQVLYLLISPNFFDPTEEMGAYIEGREREAGFWLERREYFEITPEAEKLIGAERAVASCQRALGLAGEELNAIIRNKKGAGLDDKVRLMTWRDV